MAKLAFETAGLADALKRADKVAPSRGEAFDKAAGIVLDIQEKVVVVKSTNLATEFSTWITPQEIEGAPSRWRLASRTFTDVICKLKTGRHSQVVLEDAGKQIKMQHGSTRGAFGKMDPNSYPDWVPFDPGQMEEVEGLPEAAARVQWAASTGTNPPITGVHFDGKLAMATNRYKVCSMPMPMELKEPITVPSGVLNTVLPQAAPVLYRVEKHALYLMPDEYTQIATVVYGAAYPPVQRLMKRDYPQMVTVQRSHLLDMMDLANTMSGSSRNPIIRLFVGNETVAVMMENAGEGHLGDIMEVPGQATNERLERKFNPEYLMGALDNSPGQEVVIGYETDSDRTGAPLYINGGSGVEFWIAPLSPEAVAAANAAE